MFNLRQTVTVVRRIYCTGGKLLLDWSMYQNRLGIAS